MQNAVNLNLSPVLEGGDAPHLWDETPVDPTRVALRCLHHVPFLVWQRADVHRTITDNNTALEREHRLGATRRVGLVDPL